jgi:hypothetical protein
MVELVEGFDELLDVAEAWGLVIVASVWVVVA